MPSAFQRKARTLPSAADNVASSASGTTAEAGASTSSSSSSGATSTPTTTPSRIPTHETLRPSPFPQQQPLPLFSLGLSAINDVLTGVGLPSGCLGIFQPVQTSAGSVFDNDAELEHERVRLEAGAAYADLVLKYAAAQGVAHGHRVLVVGEGAIDWCKEWMGWAGQDQRGKEGGGSGSNSGNKAEEDAAGSAPQPPSPTPDDDEEDDNAASASSASTPLASRNNLKSAFRYDKLQKIQQRQGMDDPRSISSTSSSSASHFVHPFDLSMRMSDGVLSAAQREGRLLIEDISVQDDADAGANTYERVWSTIQSRVASSDADSGLPLRVIVSSLGSAAYSAPRDHATESYRLLMRLKRLVRERSWPTAGATTATAIATATASCPSIALCTLSPTLPLHEPSISHRLATLSDSTLALSSFAADARLRAMFQPQSSSSSSSGVDKSAVFTGSLKIIKTPTVGSLRPSSIRASTLRGMGGSGGADTDSASGTTENSLGFKVRRKGFKVEVMGRDLVAGGEGGKAEGDKQPPKRPERRAVSQAEAAAAAEDRRQEQPSAPTAPTPQPAASSALSTSTTSTSLSTPPPVSASAAAPAPRTPLKGIAALRARGLQAANKSTSTAPIEVEGAGEGAGSTQGASSPNANDDPAAAAAAKRMQGLKMAAKQDW